MTNFIKLPSGDYVNLDMIQGLEFDLDNSQIARLCFPESDTILRGEDKDYIKQFLDRNYGEFFQMHSQDYAAQILGLGYALEKLEKLSGESVESLSQEIILKANERVSKLSKKSIGLMVQHYQEQVGGGPGGNVVSIKIRA
ncbi:hypothetical protein WJM97_22270 [Okeanomitos corallinicola TIOX110]|uniref:Uncharacterized protein n=1 Tax=Okeanomitos corallinicola TIOX110 TaxID=3133117 RepID=A0ABZ2URM6_9CYAN